MTFGNLSKAVEAAILSGNVLSDIKPEWWARTYHCDTETVRETFERVAAEMAA